MRRATKRAAAPPLLALLAVSALLPGARAHGPAAEADRVTYLPGLDQTIADSLDQFAGFVSLAETGDASRKDIFYWFVESESPTRATDPLVLWTNGGPGCSGLLGFLSENGPLFPAEGGVRMDKNPYSWTSAASIIFVEQPLFVGFSISDDLVIGSVSWGWVCGWGEGARGWS